MFSRSFLLTLASTVISVALCGCSDDDSPTSGGGTTPTGTTVTSTGGTFSFVSGTVTLAVPENAVSSDVAITVATESQYPSDDGYVSGTCFEFSPDGQLFLTPITMTIGYDEADLPEGVDESTLRLCKVVGDAWSAMGGYSVDVDANEVSAPVSGFSSYGIVGTVSTGGQVYEGDYQITDSATLAAFQDYTSITGELEIWTCAPDTVLIPNLVSVGGDLYIREMVGRDPNMVHLSMPSLETVWRRLAIENCDALRTFSMPSIESAGSIVIQRNASLQDVHGLSSLSTLNPQSYTNYGSVFFYNNDSLSSLVGLSGVTGTAFGLTVRSCPRLSSLSGLGGIQHVQSLTIESCGQLTSLTGLNVRSCVEHAIVRNCTGLENLNGLENLQTVGYNLQIENCTSLTDLSGLAMVTSVGGFFLEDLSSLESLDGLGPVSAITGSLSIIDCDELTDITALEFVTSVSGNLNIESCTLIESLDGLDAITQVGLTVKLRYLPYLDNVDGLSQLDFIDGSLIINDCWRLTSVQGLWGLLPNPESGYVLQYLTIADNAQAVAPTGLGNDKAWELVDKFGGEDMVQYTITIEGN